MAQDWLGIIGVVVGQTAVCLIVLLLPILLFVWTARVVYRRRSFKATRHLMLVNVAVLFILMILMISFNTGTLYEMIITSYQFTAYMLPFAMIFSLYVWARDRYMLDPVSPDTPQPIRNQE